MTHYIDVFFYSYYLNAYFLKRLGCNPTNPRRARLSHWQLYLGEGTTLIEDKDNFSDGMIYSLTEEELAKLYHIDGIANYVKIAVEVQLLDTDTTVTVDCYIAPAPVCKQLPNNPYYVAHLLSAMRANQLSTHDIEPVFMQISTPLVLHIPHSATEIPAAYRADFTLTDAQLQRELLLMTDHYTAELFAFNTCNVRSVRFPVSRLLLDPERFLEDTDEPMAARGMGVVYTKTSAGLPLRKALTVARRQQLIDEFYHPHHLALTQHVEQDLNQYGRALVVDCHSFPAQPLPYELNQNPQRPDICLGTDDFHTPPELLELAQDFFAQAGLKVKVNEPFAGALVPLRFYQTESRVHALMVEVNRGLYMDESTGNRNANFRHIQALIHSFLAALSKP